jgi:CheY-like chemotaxis protein
VEGIKGEFVPISVVIIEDDDDVRALIIGILSGAGLQVHEASTAAAGVEAVRQHRPEVFVVDFGLPDFNGLEAVRRIREFSQAPPSCSPATTTSPTSRWPLAAGVTELMAKPFSPLELRQRVEKLVPARPATGQC